MDFSLIHLFWFKTLKGIKLLTFGYQDYDDRSLFEVSYSNCCGWCVNLFFVKVL